MCCHKVSVCIATYNGSKYIKDQIYSILPQLNEDDEIVISDDQSTDDTVEIIEAIGDKRIRIYKHECRESYTSNFENALKHATGDYIYLCDQDDVWFDNKIEVVNRYLDSYDFVMTDAMVTDGELNVVVESRNTFYHVKNGFLRNIIKTRFLGCCLAFRKSVLEFCLPFPENHELCLHDAWITFCSELYFRCAVLDTPLMYYRRHGSNASNGGNGHSSLKKIIAIRLYVCYQLIKRGLSRKSKCKERLD